MQNTSNPLNNSIKKMVEIIRVLGHLSQEFAEIAHLKNNFVTNYLIGSLGEGGLILLQEKEYLQKIMNGIIATKWQVFYDIDYEISYAKLYDNNPTTQEEFDALLRSLFEESQK
jgi:hypothetical protein